MATTSHQTPRRRRISQVSSHSITSKLQKTRDSKIEQLKTKLTHLIRPRAPVPYPCFSTTTPQTFAPRSIQGVGHRTGVSWKRVCWGTPPIEGEVLYPLRFHSYPILVTLHWQPLLSHAVRILLGIDREHSGGAMTWWIRQKYF